MRVNSQSDFSQRLTTSPQNDRSAGTDECTSSNISPANAKAIPKPHVGIGTPTCELTTLSSQSHSTVALYLPDPRILWTPGGIAFGPSPLCHRCPSSKQERKSQAAPTMTCFTPARSLASQSGNLLWGKMDSCFTGDMFREQRGWRKW